MNIDLAVQRISVAILPLIFAITVHEAAHGWVANRCGDRTALMLGRVTLNPLKHIDPLGTVVVPILMMLFSGFIFGWAKPVPVSWRNLRHPRRDMALVALAGPGANLLMAIGWGIIAKLCAVWHPGANPMMQDVLKFAFAASAFGILINCVLLVLNLLPIPPLDGSRVVSSLLPPAAAQVYERIEPYGIWILIALLMFGVLGRILWPPVQELTQVIYGLLGIPAPY